MGDIVILGMPISLGTMIYQAILFTVLIFILKRVLLSKLVAVMENRRESIDNKLQLADTYKKEAEVLLANQREMTEKATREAKEIIATGRQEAALIVKAARKDALTIRTQAYQEMRAMKERGAS